MHTSNHTTGFRHAIAVAVYPIYIDDLDDVGHRQINTGRGRAAVVVDLEAGTGHIVGDDQFDAGAFGDGQSRTELAAPSQGPNAR